VLAGENADFVVPLGISDAEATFLVKNHPTEASEIFSIDTAVPDPQGHGWLHSLEHLDAFGGEEGLKQAIFSLDTPDIRILRKVNETGIQRELRFVATNDDASEFAVGIIEKSTDPNFLVTIFKAKNPEEFWFLIEPEVRKGNLLTFKNVEDPNIRYIVLQENPPKYLRFLRTIENESKNVDIKAFAGKLDITGLEQTTGSNFQNYLKKTGKQFNLKALKD